MAKYIATDLDGTLLAPLDIQNLIPNANREIIKEFDGTIICSGRNPSFIQGVCKELNLEENFVAFNGAVIYKNGKQILKKKLDKEIINRIIDFVKEKYDFYVIFLMSDDSKIYTLNSNKEERQKVEEQEVIDFPRHRYISIKDEDEIYELINENKHIVKLNVILNPNDKDHLYKQLSGSEMPITISYCKTAIEVISGEVNKGKSLAKLVKELEIDEDDVYVIGDDNNDLSMFDYFKNSFLIKSENVNYEKENYAHEISAFEDLKKFNAYYMHPSNFTFYHLVKYYIELTEAMEYTLITYKYQEDELKERFKFLKQEYKNGFFNKIIKGLFVSPAEITKEIKSFIKKYNYKKVNKMVNEADLHSRIIYNRDLYLSVSNALEIINMCLENERIKEGIEQSLIRLVETTTRHFELFYLFNSLNLYVSSKVNILQGGIVYDLSEEDKTILLTFVSSLEDSTVNKGLLKESIKLMKEEKKFNEEDAYEVLNKVSIECIKEEKNLYTDFEAFSTKLEKEIEKLNK